MNKEHPAIRLGAAALALFLIFDASAASAKSLRNMTCSELWYQRNAIYAENGYCFETTRAIRVFGEACFPPYGQLSRSERRQVNEIVSWETRKGCR